MPKTLLHYFSDTGNSLSAAKQIRKDCISMDMKLHCMSSKKALRPILAAIPSHLLLGYLGLSPQ